MRRRTRGRETRREGRGREMRRQGRGREMRRQLRITLVALLALAIALFGAADALAAAGGGSGGFGGGGHGGRGAGLYILIQILIRLAIFGHGLGILIIIGLIIAVIIFTNVAPRARSAFAAQQTAGRAARRRTAHRERRVELAAAEAADEDPMFAPEHVRSAAARLFADVQAAWDAQDRNRLSKLVARDLLAEWQRRLDDLERRGWRNRVKPVDEPRIEYIGLVHRGSIAEDRVTVRMEAKLRDYVEDRHGNHVKRSGRLSETIRIREFWTLGKSKDGKRWILRSIEQGAEGSHALEEAIVATPWSDDQALRDEALVEGAAADAVPEGTKISEVAALQFSGDARAQALDLSLADARFAPDILEVAARRAVAAWAEAVDGDDSALRTIATEGSVRELLHPGDPSARTRLVVRGPEVEQIRIEALDPAADPPTMKIGVEIAGRRYIEDRSTTEILAGSQSRIARFVEEWTLALQGDDRQPWRIVAVRSAVPSV